MVENMPLREFGIIYIMGAARLSLHKSFIEEGTENMCTLSILFT